MRKFLILAISTLLVVTSDACSICGSGGGNMYFGIYPIYKKSFLGVRHTYEEYHTHIFNDSTQFSNNYYNTTDVILGTNIGNRIQITVNIPFRSILKAHDDGRVQMNGLGDISFNMNYNLFKTSLSTHVPGHLSQEIWVGAGIKLATGYINIDFSDTTTTLADINSQIGSGSSSILFNIRHSMEISGFGLNTAADLKVSPTNSQGYKYGSIFTMSTTAFYRLAIKDVSITPSAGLIYEKINGNSFNGAKVILNEGLDNGQYNTGGYSLGFAGGIQTNYNRISISTTIQTPLQQEFAKGQTKMGIRGMLSFTYAL